MFGSEGKTGEEPGVVVGGSEHVLYVLPVRRRGQEVQADSVWIRKRKGGCLFVLISPIFRV
jgi:hypothetical protein